ncbi:MAG TPA: alkaline phosphatase family protein [Blastocatellia bacterium]|nr:alkaline phosphatase family protein [Blastocatellia bacterium]
MKTVIIGLDGATFDIIKPLAGDGRLPVLRRLMRDGVSAPLRSTILPNSFPGWASCTTGTSEGMHGVFSPFIKNESSYSVRAMSGRDIMTRSVWDFVTDHGGRSIVLNVPTTYPPEPLNGLMVTGMLTPAAAADFTFPASLKEDLVAAVPDYVIEPGRDPDKHRRAADFRTATEGHERAARFLMSQGDWDFFMVVFSVLDRAQHDFWADMDSSHPRHDPVAPQEFRRFIRETYQQLDSVIGTLIESLPADVRVLIVSDHGFCAELMEVRVNEVLAAAGLLKFKSPYTRKARATMGSLREKVRRRLKPAEARGSILERKVLSGGSYLSEIDWLHTRAYFAQDKGVWVNLVGREPQGIVAESRFDEVVVELRQVLLGLMHDGDAVFERVLTRDEAFTGRHKSRLPDVVMIPRRDEYVYNERPGYGRLIVPADSTSGTHARDGIFIAWGRGIKPATKLAPQLENADAAANLRDVGPTALYSLGLALTDDMDGRVLTQIFPETVGERRAGSSYRSEDPAEKSAYSESEEAEVTDRLRALGYIE